MRIQISKHEPDVRQLLDIVQQRGHHPGHVLIYAASGWRYTTSFGEVERFYWRDPDHSTNAPPQDRLFDLVLLLDLDFERAESLATLAQARRCIAPEGLMLAHIPSGIGASARQTAHLRCLAGGFGQVWFHGGKEQRWKSVFRKNGVMLSARPNGELAAQRTCSIIVPVYNERDTFSELMELLLAKRLDHLGLRKEIILVESNSTDGTREAIKRYEGEQGVRVLYQDGPRGKGNAVREGLRAATGDIVLIQDADLEYDLADYECLLEPLIQEKAAFVLGSRLGGRLKMRNFEDQPFVGGALNLGQVFFTWLLNRLYGQSMKDPFTMFKVFRRDCLYGLQFECDRFDFDHELVIKLVLKGYVPLEVPVAYSARSFKQGKKVRVVRDTLSWLKADFKFRFARLRPCFD